ncbi:MAG: TIGR03620 family F420-dependent LLM class oxidoreductase [Deltaproteobacteria bacterium]|nr:TIGR03620 family F420-dependent LLM class oxidoreductase [Deltaproteobacteria bacterium]MBW2446866.1 TIGR03620 family F420-dependent LLM class oxidoreductase [Deltaproteobacteria bacterium]
MTTEIGKLGVWTPLDANTPEESVEFAQQLEAWGYSALWIPEAVGIDPFCTLAYLAARTEKIVLATGIANIYARDPMTLKAIHKTMATLAPGRFVLGIGVSHSHLVEGVRGHEYKKPVPAMRETLDAMEKALFMARGPVEEAPIVLAALRPLMLKLAATRTRGAHPYFVTPEHTKRARERMGPDAWLCPEQKVLLETDAEKAREVGRAAMKIYLRAPNYQNNLRDLGFDDSDWEGARASDRLVDAIVAWGDAAALRERIAAHHDAGATHVCIQPLRADGGVGADLAALEALAPAAEVSD